MGYALLVLPLIYGCGETPTIPTVSADSLVVLLVADPDMSSQPLVVARATAGEPLAGLRAEIVDGSGNVWSGTAAEAGDVRPCNLRYGALMAGSSIYCIVIDWSPEPGMTYELAVVADNAPPASAIIQVPDRFELRRLSADHDLSEVRSVEADWTPAAGAYRYYAMVLPAQLPPCWQTLECRDGGWLAVTSDTALNATIGSDEFHAGARGPWTFQLAAVPEALHRALNSGSGEEFFPVPAIDNVEGGFGVAAAWTKVSMQLP